MKAFPFKFPFATHHFPFRILALQRIHTYICNCYLVSPAHKRIPTILTSKQHGHISPPKNSFS